MAAPRALLAGASRYMGSLLVGVLFAPVLPDMAVDVLGSSSGAWWNALLRLGSLVFVLGVCVAVYAAQVASTARRARRAGLTLSGLGLRDVLVLPIGFTAGYSPTRDRPHPNTIQEWLVDSCQPQHVVAVGTSDVRARLDEIREGLREDGITVDEVVLTDPKNPDVAVREAQHLVVACLAARSLIGRSCYVDTTGGLVPMSIAMLRLGALLGVECTYVASEFADKKIVPGTQSAHAFYPAALFATP